MKLFTVDGNIGSGKSTFLKYMTDTYPHIITIQEPVEEWFRIKDEYNQSLFENFYKDPQKYSYLFQMYILNSRFKKIKNQIDIHKDNKNIIILAERSMFTDLHIFVSALIDTKQFTKLEYDVFIMWFNTLLELYDINIHGFIYISTEPNICYDRIKKRSRPGENIIDINYLNILHSKHEKWLNNNIYNILNINGNDDFDIMIQNENSRVQQFITNDKN